MALKIVFVVRFVGQINCSYILFQVSLEATVRSVGAQKKQMLSYGQRLRQDVIISDKSGTIKLTLWEHLVNGLDEGASYKFELVATRDYQAGVLSLTSTTSSVFSKIASLGEVSTEKLEEDVEVVKVDVCSVDVMISKRCDKSPFCIQNDFGTIKSLKDTCMIYVIWL